MCAAYGGPKRAKELKGECEHAPILTTGATSWRADEVRELRRGASEQTKMVIGVYLEHFAAIGAAAACARLRSGGGGSGEARGGAVVVGSGGEE